ncbi:MAG: hypothetical protein AAGF25_03555 [Pseudomonadota bacterium]
MQHRSLRRLAIGALVLAAAPAFAQTSTQAERADADEITTVSAFNQICYARVPNVQAIGDMATEFAWHHMDEDELKAFETGGQLDFLKGWDAKIGERVYRVAVSQGPVTKSQLETFPDFVDGLTTSCSFILDGLDLPGVVAADMQTLAGKDPVSKDVPEDDLKTTLWAGGNDDVKVFLVSKSGGENGGLLNVTVLTK